MSIILTINSGTETFNSELPEGIVGDVAAVELITPENVKSIEVGEYGEYEENIDGEFTVGLLNGDIIRIDGYNGMWELLHVNKLKDEVRTKTINDFRDWVKWQVEYMTTI